MKHTHTYTYAPTHTPVSVCVFVCFLSSYISSKFATTLPVLHFLFFLTLDFFALVGKKHMMIVWHSLQEYAFERQVFCAESHQKPYRKFLTGLLDQFVAYYYALTPILRHHYEVIPYDNTCRLYFDVEYKRAFNTELDEEEIMTILKSGIICAVAQFLGAEINETNIVDLVATTDQKMSHHLIVHIPASSKIIWCVVTSLSYFTTK